MVNSSNYQLIWWNLITQKQFYDLTELSSRPPDWEPRSLLTWTLLSNRCVQCKADVLVKLLLQSYIFLLSTLLIKNCEIVNVRTSTLINTLHTAICPFSIINHTWRQNAVSKKKISHARHSRVCHWFGTSEIFQWTDLRLSLKHYNEVPIKIRARCSLYKKCFLLIILIWWLLYLYSQEFRCLRLDTTIKFLILSSYMYVIQRSFKVVAI